jgi:hypothetical protein
MKAANPGFQQKIQQQFKPLSHRDRLIAFYQLHNRSKLDTIDDVLEKYKGREERLFVLLEQKYGVKRDAARTIGVEQGMLGAQASLASINMKNDGKHEEQLKAERQVLVELYRGAQGDQWKHKGGWVSNARIARGEWYGVHATNCKVVTMKLPRNRLQGKLPGTIGQLHHLQVLHLQNNRLTGAIPHSLSNLKVVKDMDLSFNQLKGVLPDALAHCTALTRLRLQHNQLSSTVPKSFGGY